jgi:CheY-like chemotaxis protein
VIEFDGREHEPGGTQHHWRLVVADDMSLNADGLSDVLRMMAHDLVTAYDGIGAISAHCSFRPDAYIIDLGMPGMDGYQTCQAIRALPGGDAVAIIALSGWGRNEDVTRSMEVGFSSFLPKPAHPREILHCLDRIIFRNLPPDRRRTNQDFT